MGLGAQLRVYAEGCMGDLDDVASAPTRNGDDLADLAASTITLTETRVMQLLHHFFAEGHSAGTCSAQAGTRLLEPAPGTGRRPARC